MISWLSTLLWSLAPWRIDYIPGTPGLIFTFTQEEGSMDLTCTVTFSAADPRVAIAKRTFGYAINVAAGATPTYMNLDATAGPVSFACKAGDVIEYEAFDTSAGGLDSPKATGTVTANDNVTVPVMPVLTFAFALAAPAA